MKTTDIQNFIDLLRLARFEEEGGDEKEGNKPQGKDRLYWDQRYTGECNDSYQDYKMWSLFLVCPL